MAGILLLRGQCTLWAPLCDQLLRCGAAVSCYRHLASGATPSGSAAPDSPAVKKLLVANRGEIACRVLQTARRLGIPTVAVYSDADAHSLHVERADEAFRIGPAAARDSYLRGDIILQVAKATGATAIHPGYGFLSENAAFAEQCEAAGVTFVGPPAKAIAAMGDKSEAKALMTAAGVPVVPGYHGEDQSDDRLRQEAERIGFPLLVKATRGGGGKGMKLAQTPDDLEDAIASAKREAAASFGNDRLLLERYISAPRHVEVQVFADSHGGAVYLHERDCSVQRRHQKVIEEAPAPGLSAEFRRSIGEAAVAAARAVGYVNAGTVEFILDTDTGDYFFMETNTRLQVEHPVTEAITGLDLVEWQLRVAAGEHLPLRQDQLQLLGHAFEARLYAESPENDFLPGSGTIARWRMPPESAAFTVTGPDVRVDSGVREGDAVGLYYDPMIAKVIARGPDRATALARLHGALSELQVSGLPTNQAFLKRLAGHPAFMAAELDTRFIPQHQAELLAPPRLEPRLAALAGVAMHSLQVQEAANSGRPCPGPWGISDSARLHLAAVTRLALAAGPAREPLAVDITHGRGGKLSVEVAFDDADTTVAVRGVQLAGDSLSAEVDGQRLSAQLASYMHMDEQVLDLWVGGEAHQFRRAVPSRWARVGGPATSAATVTTRMPGRITKVFVTEGEEVAEGDPLLALEAMKMEHTVRAPRSGIVRQLAALEGAQVADGAVLAVVEPLPEAAQVAAQAA